METIELKPRELHIKTLQTGEKVVQIRGNVAFDIDFVQECQEKGVKEYEEREE